MKKSARIKIRLNPKKWISGDQKPAEQMGLGLGTVLFLLALIAFLRGNPVRAEKLSLAAAIFAGIAFAYPGLLLPLEKILRNMVKGLAWLNTKLMLALVYYLVFTPMGFLLKIFGKKLVEKEFRPVRRSFNEGGAEAESYFEPKEEKEYQPDQDELQF